MAVPFSRQNFKSQALHVFEHATGDSRGSDFAQLQSAKKSGAIGNEMHFSCRAAFSSRLAQRKMRAAE
jgi:hypothetical protein